MVKRWIWGPRQAGYVKLWALRPGGHCLFYGLSPPHSAPERMSLKVQRRRGTRRQNPVGWPDVPKSRWAGQGSARGRDQSRGDHAGRWLRAAEGRRVPGTSAYRCEALPAPGPAASFAHSTDTRRVPTVCQELYLEPLEFALKERTAAMGVVGRHTRNLRTLPVAQRKWHMDPARLRRGRSGGH